MAVRIEKIPTRRPQAAVEEARENPAEGSGSCVDARVDLVHVESTPGALGAGHFGFLYRGHRG